MARTMDKNQVLAHMEVGGRVVVLVKLAGTLTYEVRHNKDGVVATTVSRNFAYTTFMQVAERLVDLTDC